MAKGKGGTGAALGLIALIFGAGMLDLLFIFGMRTPVVLSFGELQMQIRNILSI